MKYLETVLKDALVIQPELLFDNRGFFAQTYCEDDFYESGLNIECAQCNVSHNDRKQTLRGLHYQIYPYEQDKYLTCTHGSIQDVIVDLRKDSPTYLGWQSFVLSRENRTWLYIPAGFAHGYITLEDDTDIFYQISKNHYKEYEAGIRYDDPKLNIRWMLEPLIISERDRAHPRFEE